MAIFIVSILILVPAARVVATRPTSDDRALQTKDEVNAETSFSLLPAAPTFAEVEAEALEYYETHSQKSTNSAEMISSIASQFGAPHAWAIVYTAKDLIFTFLNDPKQQAEEKRSVQEKLYFILATFKSVIGNAILKDIVFDRDMCSEASPSADSAKLIECASAVLTSAINVISTYAKTTASILGISEPFGPLVTILHELFVCTKRLTTEGMSLQLVGDLIVPITQLVLLAVLCNVLSAGVGLYYTISAADQLVGSHTWHSEKLPPWLASEFDVGSFSWKPFKVGRQCLKRVSEMIQQGAKFQPDVPLNIEGMIASMQVGSAEEAIDQMEFNSLLKANLESDGTKTYADEVQSRYQQVIKYISESYPGAIRSGGEYESGLDCTAAQMICGNKVPSQGGYMPFSFFGSEQFFSSDSGWELPVQGGCKR